jgi:hypothetical protein
MARSASLRISNAEAKPFIYSRLALRFVVVLTLLEQLWIYLHEKLERVKHHAMNSADRQLTSIGSVQQLTGSNATLNSGSEPERRWAEPLQYARPSD